MTGQNYGEGWREVIGLAAALLVLASSRMIIDVAAQARFGSVGLSRPVTEQMRLYW